MRACMRACVDVGVYMCTCVRVCRCVYWIGLSTPWPLPHHLPMHCMLLVQCLERRESAIYVVLSLLPVLLILFPFILFHVSRRICFEGFFKYLAL